MEFRCALNFHKHEETHLQLIAIFRRWRITEFSFDFLTGIANDNTGRSEDADSDTGTRNDRVPGRAYGSS